MARQPSQLEIIGGKSPRQRMWEAIKQRYAKGKTFTQADIEAAATVEASAIKDYFKVLVTAGFITVLDRVKLRNNCVRYTYELTKDNGVEAPRIDKKGNVVTEGTCNERMWGTMRRLFVGRDFNYRELAAFASTSANVCNEGNAKTYVLLLHRAGYLECTTPAKSGKAATPARFALIKKMNTGQRAPMIQRTKTVFDANLGKVMWQEPAGEQDE
ncbi:hypothetical protein [Undibacterium sp.]|uniref:hypothetical protein n=1 Tax=Undibacterium sp. TaxID=1914977 RepID=UPI00272FEA3E|nr:hypothetical protein [Undibacterium sp.]MDP1980505.1 hypothetical protein [Undibacterium sp.]